MAHFCRGDQVRAVATMGRDPAAARWAERFAAGGFVSKESVAAELAAETEAE